MVLFFADQRDKREELPPRGSGKPRPPTIQQMFVGKNNLCCCLALQVQVLRNAGEEVTLTVSFLKKTPAFLKLPLCEDCTCKQPAADLEPPTAISDFYNMRCYFQSGIGCLDDCKALFWTLILITTSKKRFNCFKVSTLYLQYTIYI